MSPTAMQSAFADAGIRPELVEFDIAIAKLLNSGGTIEDAKERLAIAEQKLSGAAMASLPSGQANHAAARQAEGDDPGQLLVAAEAPFRVPGSSPDNRERAGQSSSAPGGHSWHSGFAREPSQADRAAMRIVRKDSAAITLTVFDSWKIRDGRPLGDVTFGELESLRFENAREASVIRQIQKHVAHADASARVRDILKIDDLQRMIQRAAEVADVA